MAQDPQTRRDYDNCVWDAYEASGWKPTCVDFRLAKNVALNRSSDPAYYRVVSNEGEAKCYITYFADQYELQDFVVVNASEPPQSSCKDAFEAKQALEFNELVQLFPTARLLPPNFMQDELAKIDSLNQTEVEAAFSACEVCNTAGTGVATSSQSGGGGSSNGTNGAVVVAGAVSSPAAAGPVSGDDMEDKPAGNGKLPEGGANSTSPSPEDMESSSPSPPGPIGSNITAIIGNLTSSPAPAVSAAMVPMVSVMAGALGAIALSLC